jgi:hypothetical protein
MGQRKVGGKADGPLKGCSPGWVRSSDGSDLRGYWDGDISMDCSFCFASALSVSMIKI